MGGLRSWATCCRQGCRHNRNEHLWSGVEGRKSGQAGPPPLPTGGAAGWFPSRMPKWEKVQSQLLEAFFPGSPILQAPSSLMH